MFLYHMMLFLKLKSLIFQRTNIENALKVSVRYAIVGP